MTDIHGPQETKATIRFCPQCGSASLSFVQSLMQPFEGGASCSACGWSGKGEELASMEFSHEFASEEEIVKALVGDLRVTIAKDAGASYAGFLSKWGFLPSPDPKLLARYLAAIARATLNAIMKERALIDKEKVDGQRN
jgi:hypothetical protein